MLRIAKASRKKRYICYNYTRPKKHHGGIMKKYKFIFNGKRNKKERGEILFSITTDNNRLIRQLEEDIDFCNMVVE
jgi:hypothetical protein